MSAFSVTLLGSSALLKTALAGQLRSCDQTVQIFTPDAVLPASQEGLTFLLVPNNPRANDAHAERLLRSDLDRHCISYQVLYGTTDECLTQALQAIQSTRSHQPGSSGSAQEVVSDQAGGPCARWVWTCDKCSDPQCEHQLLTGLLAKRQSRITELLP